MYSIPMRVPIALVAPNEMVFQGQYFISTGLGMTSTESVTNLS